MHTKGVDEKINPQTAMKDGKYCGYLAADFSRKTHSKPNNSKPKSRDFERVKLSDFLCWQISSRLAVQANTQQRKYLTLEKEG